MKKTKQSPIGTSFHDSTIDATYVQLTKALGEPKFKGNDGKGKVNFEWDMETETGEVFTVYDYKEYRKLKRADIVNWHIGGNNSAITELGRHEVLEALRLLNY